MKHIEWSTILLRELTQKSESEMTYAKQKCLNDLMFVGGLSVMAGR